VKVLCPLPDRDFDVTEISVPWKLLTEAGHDVVFATERGDTPAADPRLIDGVIFGQLGAKPEPLAFYRELEQRRAFRSPLRFADVDPSDFGALHLAGGHAPGMRPYLESEEVQHIARAFFAAKSPVSAICHGVIVLARAGLLGDRRTTCLPKYMERLAYWSTAWRLGRYYRTYDAYVEDEVRAQAREFVRGPFTLFAHGTRADDTAAFVVEDGAYVSARWPGDAYLLAKKLLARLTSASMSKMLGHEAPIR
jgi:putative intracellular protease/amidase